MSFLKRVDGEYQGACFNFIDGLECGALRLAFLSDGSMIVGETNRGWNSQGSRSFGLERIRWTGRMPFEILKMEARPDGFEITFTGDVDASRLPTQRRLPCRATLTLIMKNMAVMKLIPAQSGSRKPNRGADRRSVRLHCEGFARGVCS